MTATRIKLRRPRDQHLSFRCLLLLALGSATTPAIAQSPTDRAGLDRFRDSLSRIQDSVSIRTLEHSLEAGPSDSAGRALTELRRGFICLRIGETGDGWSFGRAAKAFDRAADLRPTWPYPRYGLGLAQAARGRWLAADPLNLGTRVGHGSLHDAVKSFAQALDLEPGFGPAIRSLDSAATELRDTTLYAEVLLPVHRRAAETPAGQEPEVLYHRGMIEREVGDPDSSVLAFRAYLANGGEPGLGKLELARSLFARGSMEGVPLYYEGAEDDDSGTVAQYRADLALIEDDGVLAEFDSTQGEARVAFLKQVWTRRDQLEMREPGERLKEHYRRIRYARQNFRLLTNRAHYGPAGVYRSFSTEFDNRGVIYIRQGEPTRRISTPIYGLWANETWLYERADGNLLFHFSGGGDQSPGGDLQDYRLVPSIFELRGQGVPEDILLHSRCELWTLYCKMGNWLANGRAHAEEREREIVGASIAVGTTTDAYDLTFPKRLSTVANLVVVGRASEQSLAHLVFAIPLEPADSSLPSALLRLPVRLRFVAYDSTGHPVATFDSAEVLSVAPDQRRSPEARGRFEFPLPPGHWLYRMVIQSGEEIGTVFPRDTIGVPRLDGTALGLSDLVLGTRSRGVLWISAPGDTAVFQANGEVFQDEPLELYYEIYGLLDRGEYDTRIRVRPAKSPGLGNKLFGGRKGELSLSFHEEASGAVTRAHRTVGLQSLKPGEYLLELIVQAADGSELRRVRAFTVVNGKR